MSKRVAMIGAGPLPIYEGQSSMGPGIRTWQLAKPLIQQGHQVLLVTFEFAVGPDWDFESPRYTVELDHIGAVEHLSLPEPLPGTYESLIGRIRSRVRDFHADAVVSAGAFFASRIAVALEPEQPLWIDLFGNTMAEVQAKVARTSTNEAEFFRFLYQTQLSILRRGDRFSALSTPQKMAVIGELSLSGRLNAQNLGYDLVEVIPCGYDGDVQYEHKNQVLRGIHVGQDDFVVLWTGGFNSWVDEQTLFEGLIQAMQQDSSIQWVSLGGGIRGHFQKGYDNFRSQAEASAFKNRFLFLDWIPTDQVSDYFFESDIGINVDLPIYEALLGGRNRIVGWMAAGLPVLTTEISEISHILKQEGIGFTVPVKNADLLAKQLLDLSRRRECLMEVGKKAQDYATRHLTFQATTAPLSQWIENPKLAPDRQWLKKEGLAHLNSLDETLDRLIQSLQQGSEPEPAGPASWFRQWIKKGR